MEQLVHITLDQRDARTVLAALDAYGISLGEIVAFGNAAASDLEGDVIVIDPRLQELTAKMAQELAEIRERILAAVNGEDDYWGQAAPAEYCWCGKRAHARVDDLGLAVEAPEGTLLCEGHWDEFHQELALQAREHEAVADAYEALNRAEEE